MIEHTIPPGNENLPDRSTFKCPRCSETFDPGLQSMIASDGRPLPEPWGRVPTHLLAGKYPGNTHTHRALQAFIERHRNCIGPEEVTVSERGITCIDRRRVKL